MASRLASRAISQSNADLIPARKAESSVTSCEAPAVTNPAPRRSHFAHYVKHPGELITPLAFSAVLTAVLLIGFLNRNEGHLTPEQGLGYWLGIIGGSSMLLLLLYPLRKRIKVLRLIGGVTFWFRIHMILGLVGPALVLFHCNFQLGSLNSNVALFAMLIVAGSGVVGRYLYTKIHLGLYGRKAAVHEILADAEAIQRLLGEGVPASSRIVETLNSFGTRAVAPRTGVLGSFWSMAALTMRARTVRRQLASEARSLIKREGKRRGWSRRARRNRLAATIELITVHLAAVRKAAAFAFYERLFALWHVLHLPLFFLLVLAAVVHVVAVHFY
jgi:hypothetical protein